jgi:hypothetical protein
MCFQRDVGMAMQRRCSIDLVLVHNRNATACRTGICSIASNAIKAVARADRIA